MQTVAPAAVDSDPNCRVYVGNLSYRTRWQDLKDHFRQVGEVKRATIFTDGGGRSKGCGIVEFVNAADATRAISQLHDSKVPPDTERPIFVREDRGERAPRSAAGDASGDGGLDAPARRARPFNNGGGRQNGGATAAAAAAASASGAPAASMPAPTWVTPAGGQVLLNAAGGAGGADPAAAAAAGAPAAGGVAAAADGGDVNGSVAGRQLYVSNLPWRTSWQDLKDHFRVHGNVRHTKVFMQNGRSKGTGTVLFETPEEAQKALAFDNTDFQGRTIYVKLDSHVTA